MGIVKEKLADFELEDGQNICIEYNESGSIHMHVDQIRIDLKPQQLKQLSNIILEAEKELENIKNSY